MSVVAPAILAEESEGYRQTVEKYQPFAERVHIDFSDGEFAPSLTVTPDQIWWPKEWQADIHAMVARPEEYVDTLIKLKPNLIIFHAEAEGDLLPIIKQIQQTGIKAGVALQKGTVPASVQSYIENVDHVMIFSGELGKYGGTASMMQLEKVRLIKQLRPMVEIGWDGGVTAENAYTLAQGHVDVLNAGGLFANAEDPEAVYETVMKNVKKQGVL